MNTLKLFFLVALIYSSVNAQVGINTKIPDESSALEIYSENKGFLPPRMTTVERDGILLPAKALIVYNFDNKCLEINIGNSAVPEWTCLGSGDMVNDIPPPATIELDNLRDVHIGSVFDNDYIPFDLATQQATSGGLTDTLDADGTADLLADFQGILDGTGITFKIGATTTDDGTLSAFSSVVNVPANLTQDGNARNIIFGWEEQNYANGDDFITAYLKAETNDLLVKKLDVNRGFGADKKGIKLAEFSYPYNSNGDLGTLTYIALPGIPDRNIVDPDHIFVYLPVNSTSGAMWLNNNLGANYSNVNHPDFNPTNQATSHTDVNAYGGLHNWGRRSDGHEFRDNDLATTTSFSTPTPNSTVSVRGRFYNGETSEFQALWDGEAAPNNPCPIGYKVPNQAEMVVEEATWSPSNRAGAAASPLGITAAGLRSGTSPANEGNFGYYLSSTPASLSAFKGFFISATAALVSNRTVSQSASVRCIKN